HAWGSARPTPVRAMPLRRPTYGRSAQTHSPRPPVPRVLGHWCAISELTPTGKPPPLAVRLEQALPFRRCVRGEDVLWGSPASQTIQKPQAQYHGEARSSGVVPRRVPSLNEECALMHPLQGASFLSTPLQGGILKPPALRVVGDSPASPFVTPTVLQA